MPEESVVPITQLEYDPRNARKRTERSSQVIAKSLSEFGPLRSLVGQKLPDGRIIVRAGNGTLEEASQVGIDKVRIIERKPDELVVVVADDLDETQWQRYAIADNRASDLSTWDAEILAELSQEVDLGGFILEDELEGLLGELEVEGDDDEEIQVPDFLKDAVQSANQKAQELKSNSMQGIIIEFYQGDYATALELIKDLKSAGVYMGGVFLEALKNARA